MSSLLDSNVAVHARDRHPAVLELLRELEPPLFLSALSRVELEGGIVRVPELAAKRRASLNVLLQRLTLLAFDDACGAAYGGIIAVTGWSRSKIFDRMIAATALVHDLTLVTMNGPDFRDIPGLKLEIWPNVAG